jgi:Holliday junction resolvase RusA-like endonuclease
MTELRFVISGCPVGAVRQVRSDKWKDRPRVLRYRLWRDLARLAEREARMKHMMALGKNARTIGAPDEVHLVAWFDLPRERSSRANLDRLPDGPHREKPDADNVLKSLMDALFEEDKAVHIVSCSKRWAREGGARLEVLLRWL